MSEIKNMYENANIKPEYRYDCNLADTIKPVVVYSLCSCSKGEIKDYCTNKQDYRYCKVYKVNKIYPPFTAEKQIAILQLLTQRCDLAISHFTEWEFIHFDGQEATQVTGKDFAETFAKLINEYWQDLTKEEKQQVKEILE